MSACRSCGAEVVWWRTPKGRPMPLDPVARADGNVGEKPGGGFRMLSAAEQAEPAAPTERRYVSHFATCPNAKEHRR